MSCQPNYVRMLVRIAQQADWSYLIILSCNQPTEIQSLLFSNAHSRVMAIHYRHLNVHEH